MGNCLAQAVATQLAAIASAVRAPGPADVHVHDRTTIVLPSFVLKIIYCSAI